MARVLEIFNQAMRAALHYCVSSADQQPPTAPNGTFLMLGGDHRKNRVRTAIELWRHGLLRDALWSLQTPSICGGKVACI